MTDYTKLVEALRLCQFGECGCGKCYYKELKGDWCTEDNHPEFFDCDDKLKLDAASAIEELQKTLKAVQKNSGINFGMWKEAVTEVKSGNTNSCSIKNPEIKIGDTIRCLNCNKKIILDSNTFVFDFSGEYIVCPSCGATYDVLQYHIYGEKCDRKEE